MQSLLVRSLALSLLLLPFSLGCGGSDPTVIEPDNDEQLEMMRQMVEGETAAQDEAEALRED